MTDICPKCLGTDLAVKYYAANQLVNSQGRHKVEDEFVSSVEYEFYWKWKAAKEHLFKHCRRCQYNWRENVADAKS